MNLINSLFLTMLSLVFLSGCSSTTRHALTGGAIGAGLGATGAVLTDKDVEKGAILGGGTGAALGAVWD